MSWPPLAPCDPRLLALQQRNCVQWETAVTILKTYKFKPTIIYCDTEVAETPRIQQLSQNETVAQKLEGCDLVLNERSNSHKQHIALP